MDTGRARRFGDYLGVKGFKNATVVAAAARWLWWYDEYRQGNLTSQGGVTNPEMQIAVDRYSELPEMAELAVASREAKHRVPTGILAFVLTKGARIDKVCTETFLYGFETLVGLEEGSPILLLRQKMDRIKSGADGANDNAVSKAALVIKAWNMFKRGQTGKRLTYSTVHGESFPTFAGE
jgi:hypothetical protein